MSLECLDLINEIQLYWLYGQLITERKKEKFAFPFQRIIGAGEWKSHLTNKIQRVD